MNDLWQKLLWRLQAIANNRSYGDCDGTALIHINLIMREDELKGWWKPQRTPLEPKQFDISTILKGQRRIQGWEQVIKNLQEENGRMIDKVLLIDKVLVVLDGEPIGWL